MLFVGMTQFHRRHFASDESLAEDSQCSENFGCRVADNDDVFIAWKRNEWIAHEYLRIA